MSNIYVQEPPTEGKVVLETSVGEIEIELWSREAPKACRNFVQLCMENYYNKTIFHRVVKEWIVQGGDPTGTGNGGESIYGAPFKDELHSRLRFVRRGLVAMANAGKDDNASQFFFTMGTTPELMNKHTIFGRVVGDTVYNMLKLQEGVIKDERPDYPNKILRAKVLNNPFPDIAPRKVIEMEKEKRDKKPKSNMKATKDFKLLSFGEEAEEDEEDIETETKKFGKGKKSSHDLLQDPKLSKEVGIEVDSESDHEEDLMPPPPEKKPKVDVDSIKEKLKGGKKGRKKEQESMTVYEEEEELDEVAAKEKRREEIRKEIKALKKEMKRGKDNPEEEKSSGDLTNQIKALTEEEKANDLLLAFHREQEKHKELKREEKKGKKKTKTSDREEATLKMLAKFKNKMHSVKEEGEGEEKKEGEEGELDESVEGDSWMKKSLKFESDDPVLAKDASTKDDDWFDIYDPRNPLNKRRREADQKSGGGKNSRGGSRK